MTLSFPAEIVFLQYFTKLGCIYSVNQFSVFFSTVIWHRPDLVTKMFFFFFFPLVKCQVCILQREDIFSKMKINEYKPIKSVKAPQVTLMKFYSVLKAGFVHIF